MTPKEDEKPFIELLLKEGTSLKRLGLTQLVKGQSGIRIAQVLASHHSLFTSHSLFYTDDND